MEASRLPEILHDRERCEFCADCNDDAFCAKCDQVKGVSVSELRTYYAHLTELVKAEQKRREGCRRCWSGECMMSGFDYSCETTCDKCRYNLKDKQFCPHCGRDLKGESHDGD